MFEKGQNLRGLSEITQLSPGWLGGIFQGLPAVITTEIYVAWEAVNVWKTWTFFCTMRK